MDGGILGIEHVLQGEIGMRLPCPALGTRWPCCGGCGVAEHREELQHGLAGGHHPAPSEWHCQGQPASGRDRELRDEHHSHPSLSQCVGSAGSTCSSSTTLLLRHHGNYREPGSPRQLRGGIQGPQQLQESPDASAAIPGMCFRPTCWEVTHPLPVP